MAGRIGASCESAIAIAIGSSGEFTGLGGGPVKDSDAVPQPAATTSPPKITSAHVPCVSDSALFTE
ncbi:MAG: hypothetical protein MI923_11260 [Phycisphaerales bacterium]|nr:hypothetical protein [Phycisphaerales bacterium]